MVWPGLVFGSSANEIGRADVVRVMSYNVCWECMSSTALGSAAEYGRKCGRTKKNMCRENLIEICSRVPFDIIALQETDAILNHEIASRLTERHGHKYYVVNASYGLICVGIIYNSKKLEPIHGVFTQLVRSATGDPAPGRPVGACAFLHKPSRTTLAVVNMHAPHHEYGLRENISSALRKALDPGRGRSPSPGRSPGRSPDPPSPRNIFVFGDFNKTHRTAFALRLHGKTYHMTPAITDVKTGWNLKGTGGIAAYRKPVDNIITNAALVGATETWHNSAGKLLPPNENHGFTYANNTSDHTPVAASFRLT